MQKIVIGVLVLLVLFLAGMNAHLRSRERTLEEQLASATAVKKRVPRREIEFAPAPLPESSPVRAEAPAAAMTPDAPPPPAVPKAVTKEIPGKAMTMGLGSGGKMVWRTAEPDLGLSEAQKKIVDELKRNRDALSKTNQDILDQISRDTDEAIRAVLTPEQRAKYDNGGGASVVTVTAEASPAPVSGAKPGYLGISGDDAPGGGATVTSVYENTAARLFGLQPGDVILDFNGAAVASLSDLSAKIRSAGEGGSASLRIRRAGTEFQQAIQLGSWPK